MDGEALCGQQLTGLPARTPLLQPICAHARIASGTAPIGCTHSARHCSFLPCAGGAGQCGRICTMHHVVPCMDGSAHATAVCDAARLDAPCVHAPCMHAGRRTSAAWCGWTLHPVWPRATCAPLSLASSRGPCHACRPMPRAHPRPALRTPGWALQACRAPPRRKWGWQLPPPVQRPMTLRQLTVRSTRRSSGVLHSRPSAHAATSTADFRAYLRVTLIECP